MHIKVIFLGLFLFTFCIVAHCQSSCASVNGEPEDRRTDKSVLTIATFNAEWLFLANEQDPSSCPEVGCPYPTLEAAMKHVEDVASEIKRLNADIVNLIEVEGCDVLDALLESVGKEYGYKRYLIQGDDTYTGQNVALITRVDPIIDLERTDARATYPISNSTCPSINIDEDDYGVSKNYYTKFNVSGTVLNVFSVHFLAIPDDEERCYKREAQATVMAEYMKENTKIYENVVILGDMNDYDSTLQDINDDQPISNVLYVLSNAFAVKYHGRSFYNIGRNVTAQDLRFSCWYDRNDDCTYTKNEFSAIDHILIDPNLQTNQFVSSRYVHNFVPECSTKISDHYPIITHLDTPLPNEN